MPGESGEKDIFVCIVQIFTMNKLISLLCSLMLVAVLPSCAQSEHPSNGLKWYTSLLEAQKISNTTHKPIFGFFTGSDWCGWCMKLHHDVLDKPSFVEWAKKNVILLELDYPRRKQLSPELSQQNNELQQVFQVQGFPTVWLFYLTDDANTHKRNIDPLGSLGYPQGSEPGKEDEKFLHDANIILSKQAK